ncbi:hypothetical protein SAMN05444161_9096 [Rhizobiales bacterium GAS191]|nr:hypothetical protein SAMN05444161_9096 [Rhizobiales bacterium GAS191]
MDHTYAWTLSDENEGIVDLTGDDFYAAIIHITEAEVPGRNLRAVFHAERDIYQTERTQDFKEDLAGAMAWVEERLRDHLDDPKAKIVMSL